MIELAGRLICETETQQALVRAHLPEHIRLTRAEPGCIRFDVTEAAGGVWNVAELFADRAAFDAHQARAGASAWGQQTAGIRRDFTLRNLSDG